MAAPPRLVVRRALELATVGEGIPGIKVEAALEVLIALAGENPGEGLLAHNLAEHAIFLSEVITDVELVISGSAIGFACFAIHLTRAWPNNDGATDIGVN